MAGTLNAHAAAKSALESASSARGPSRPTAGTRRASPGMGRAQSWCAWRANRGSPTAAPRRSNPTSDFFDDHE